MDLISRQAAIDALGEKPLAWTDSEYELALQQQWEADIDAIKAVPSAQSKQRWIPCSERLPEYDGEMYLVTDYCEQINRKRLHVSYCYVNREGFWSDVPMGYKVVAWMPLPEPYVERRTDE